MSARQRRTNKHAAPERRYGYGRFDWSEERIEFHLMTHDQELGWATICGLEEREPEIPHVFVREDRWGGTSCVSCNAIATEQKIPLMFHFDPTPFARAPVPDPEANWVTQRVARLRWERVRARKLARLDDPSIYRNYMDAMARAVRKRTEAAEEEKQIEVEHPKPEENS
jgi:hypothetical protein